MRGEPSSLSSALAPGFRFHPTDEELVSYYLKRKVCGKSFRFDAISEIDIYKSEPWDLPGQSRLKSRDLEWYFFSALDKKYGNGWRTNRATDQGYWKTTGKDRSIQRGNRTVGMKKTLVYHIGRAPRGERTNWVMHEYRLVDDQLEKAGIVQEAFVLCRIFQKSGTGPKNGEQYGAPFIEEEWDEDVSIPGEEVGVGYLVAGDEQSSPPQDDAQNQENLALTNPPLNAVVLVDHDTEDDGKFVEDLNRLLDEDQKPSTDSDENDIQAELPEQDFFDFPEQFQFQMDQEPVKNEYFELDDLLDPVDNRNDDLVTEEFLNYAATNDQPVVHDGLYLEIDDLGNPVEADKPGFQMFDDYSTYFDASEDYLNYLDLDFIKSSDVNDFNLNKLSARQEAEKALQQAYLEPSVLSKTLDCENASSSEHKLENKDDAPDVKYNDGWDSTIAKQVSRMLGSISAPPAFASELLAEEASLGQKSTSQSSSTNHVTAGMIHISSTGVTGNEINSSWGKSEYMDLLLHFDLTRSGPVTVEHVMQGKAGSIVARSMLYFFFLWVLILSVSWKVGSCIYSR